MQIDNATLSFLSKKYQNMFYTNIRSKSFIEKDESIPIFSFQHAIILLISTLPIEIYYQKINE